MDSLLHKGEKTCEFDNTNYILKTEIEEIIRNEEVEQSKNNERAFYEPYYIYLGKRKSNPIDQECSPPLRIKITDILSAPRETVKINIKSPVEEPHTISTAYDIISEWTIPNE